MTTYFISILFLLSPSDYSTHEQSINSISECVTKKGYVAAISEKYLDDVIRYAVDKDYVALQKLLDAGVAVTMTDGVKVYLVDTHIFSGTVEFRIPGYTDVLWTVIEGIKCN